MNTPMRPARLVSEQQPESVVADYRTDLPRIPDNAPYCFRGRNILMLQGPVGPFFARLAKDLQWAGAKVHKVNFNGSILHMQAGHFFVVNWSVGVGVYFVILFNHVLRNTPQAFFNIEEGIL